MTPAGNPSGREVEGQGTSGGESGSGARSPRKRGKRGKTTVRAPRMPKVEETSAGGLVIDRSQGSPHAVLIARFDRRGRLVWSLPKGHLEGNETPEQAALREVREETGIEALVVDHLGTIDFWFIAENKRIHKTVHHYLMEASGGQLSDEDPEVEEVAWVPLAEVRDRLAYADERRLMDRLPDLVADAG